MRALALCTAVALLTLSCAARPTSEYYDSLYYLLYKLQFELPRVNYDPQALSPETKTQIDSFLATRRPYSRLWSYGEVSALNEWIRGNPVGTSPMNPYGFDLAARGFLQLFHEGDFEEELNRYRVTVDHDTLMTRAGTDVKKLYP